MLRIALTTRFFLGSLLLFAVLAGAGACRLIADHDEFVMAQTGQLQQMTESLFLKLENAAATKDSTDGEFATHAAAYDDIKVLLRMMAVRAEILPKNEITIEQVDLLQNSFQKLRELHVQHSGETPPREFTAAFLATVRRPIVQQIQSILTLQTALRR